MIGVTGTTLLAGIGARVRARRTSMGWTLQDIADRSGVSVRFLTDLELGKGNISIVRLASVARALDAPLVSLFPSEDDKGPVVALVGLRGAGKSTVGRALSQQLKIPFVELDGLVEKQANLSLAELFSLHGEAYYKRLAYAALLKVLARDEPIVLATGGSVVTDVETWQLLKRRTHTVWLRASPDDHWKRVRRQGDTRLMATRTAAIAELRSILSQRTRLYSEAAETIDTGSVRVHEAVRLIGAALLKVLAQDEPIVLATGGSVVTDIETWQLLKRRTHTVWLKASPDDHWKRVRRQGDTRLMATRAAAIAELRSILSQRTRLYSEAAQTIDTGSVRVQEAVRLIAASLHKREKRGGRK